MNESPISSVGGGLHPFADFGWGFPTKNGQKVLCACVCVCVWCVCVWCVCVVCVCVWCVCVCVWCVCVVCVCVLE